jgi:hypothetical protein
MRDFYSMYSFFYSAADPAMDGNINTTAPFLKLPTPDQQQRLDALRDRESEALQRLMAESKTWARIAKVSPPKDQQPMTQVWLDDDLPLGAKERNTSRNGMQWTSADVRAAMGQRALKTAFGDKYEQVIQAGLVPYWIPESGKIHAWVQLDRQEPPKAIYWELKTSQGTRRWAWADGPNEALLVGATPDQIAGRLPSPGVWHHLEVPASDLPPGALLQELKLGLFGGVCYWDGFSVSGNSRAADSLRHDPMAWWNHRKGQGVPLATSELSKAIQEGPASTLGAEQRDAVMAYFYAMVAADVPPALSESRARWESLRIERQLLEDSIPGTLIFKDRDEPRQAYVMTRGQYDAKGEPVQSRTPLFLSGRSALDGSDESKRLNRLDLARWLVSDENPLVARVAVNRFWQQLFGVGLVKTSDDFGAQGSPPSHPELLDDLASRFRDGGWNVKQLMREMVLSEAFRRDARFGADGFRLDPENRLLARGPRIRLDAEQIRDNVLAISGLLERHVGGPGFLGYQPPNLWEPVGYGDSNTRYYLQQHGNALYRRSLYAYIKRTAPPPFLSNFDAPNRELICTRRERSNTPLQALQLMNDIQHFEAARCFACRLLRDIPGQGIEHDSARTERAFSLALARAPDAFEKEHITRALEGFRQLLRDAPDKAQQVATTGERWPDPDLPASEVAPWTLVCNLILNLDETITRN